MAPNSVVSSKDGLSRYERLRLANIARNESYLESLGLGPGSVATRSQDHKKQRTIRVNQSRNTSAVGPRRSSSRLQKTKAKKTVDDPLIDLEIEKAKRWMQKHSFDSDRRGRHSYKEDSASRAPAPVATKQAARTVTPTPTPTKKQLARTAVSKTLHGTPVTMKDLREYEQDAFLALREWKRARAKELGYSDPCVICHNRTLVELCRFVPANEDELLSVWGIGANRLHQHGALMLEALSPWRQQLVDGHAEHHTGEEDVTSFGEAEPAQDWVTKASQLGLPTGPWEDRREWCASQNGCNACKRHGPYGRWAVCTQRLLDDLQDYHGGRDAGWRWYARPVGTAHLHRWWPPQMICHEEKLSAKDLPMGTMGVLELLQKQNRKKRKRGGRQ